MAWLLVGIAWVGSNYEERVFVPSAFHPRSTDPTISDHERQSSKFMNPANFIENQCIMRSLVVWDGFLKWCRGEDLNLHGV